MKNILGIWFIVGMVILFVHFCLQSIILFGGMISSPPLTFEERKQDLYERCVLVASGNKGFSIDECNKIMK